MEKIILYVLGTILGTGVGSIINMLWFKLVHNEPVFARRIHCNNCNSEILPVDMLPIYSWITRRCRCRVCKTKYSSQHIINEAAFGIITLYVLVLILK